MNTLRNICFTLLMMLVLPLASQAGDFSVLTNSMPPIKFAQEGQAKGVAGDVLNIIMKSAGHTISSSNVHTTTWTEAYNRTLTTPHTLCLAMARTPQREELFKWVGPIYTTRLGLLAKRSRNIHLTNLDDTTNYSIGTLVDSVMENILITENVPATRFIRREKIEDIVDLLVNDKIDLLAFTQTPTFHILLQKGIDPSLYEMALELRTVDLYIAFNKSTDDTLIHKLQNALDTMKKPGPGGKSRYDTIVQSYFLPNI